jgi:hypothetical protein
MMAASMIQPNAPDDRATEFKAVEGTGETYSGYTLMVEAYAAIVLILCAWLFFIWRKQASITARVEGLEGAIARAERAAARGKSKLVTDTGTPVDEKAPAKEARS